MEGQYFDWEGWDQQDAIAFSFYNCTVTKAFGPFSVGDKISDIFVDYEKGVLEAYAPDGEKVLFTGRLTMSID